MCSAKKCAICINIISTLLIAHRTHTQAHIIVIRIEAWMWKFSSEFCFFFHLKQQKRQRASIMIAMTPYWYIFLLSVYVENWSLKYEQRKKKCHLNAAAKKNKWFFHWFSMAKRTYTHFEYIRPNMQEVTTSFICVKFLPSNPSSDHIRLIPQKKAHHAFYLFIYTFSSNSFNSITHRVCAHSIESWGWDYATFVRYFGDFSMFFSLFHIILRYAYNEDEKHTNYC